MKTVFTWLGILIAVSTANAQLKKKYGDYVSPWSLGLRIGLSTPTYIGGPELSDNTKKNPTLGLAFGLVLNYNFSKKFSMYTELLFIQGGYLLKYETIDISTVTQNEVKALLGYVQIPLFAKFRFGSDAFKFTVHAGPYVGIGTGGKLTTKKEINGNSSSTTSNLEVQRNELAAFDFGAALGTGIQVRAGTGVFIADLRLNWGFSDIYNFSPKPSSNYKPFNNLIPSFTIGYMIPVGS